MFIFKFFPKLRRHIILEDCLLENLSALLFLLSFVIGVYALIFRRKIPHRKFLISVTILSLVGFLDELSFGERIFDIKMPIIRGVKIDAVHDFLFLGYQLVGQKSIVLAIMILLPILLLAIGLILFGKKKVRLKELSYFFRNRPHITFIVIFGILLIISQTLDLHIVKWKLQYWFVVEEVFELNAALALVFANLIAADHSQFGS